MLQRLRPIQRFMVRTLAVIGALSLVYHGFFDVAKVTTGCMTPFLVAGDKPDWIVRETFFTAGRLPEQRFSVVAFIDEEGTLIAKRVVGFPGETIQVTADRALFIDGIRTRVPDTAGDGLGYIPAGNLHDGVSFRVPPDHVYLLGDNTYDSQDSRFMGALPIRRIEGRVLVRVRGGGVEIL